VSGQIKAGKAGDINFGGSVDDHSAFFFPVDDQLSSWGGMGAAERYSQSSLFPVRFGFKTLVG